MKLYLYYIYWLLTSKFIEIGGLAHFFLSLVGRSSISALIWDSFIPAMRLILHTRTQRDTHSFVKGTIINRERCPQQRRVFDEWCSLKDNCYSLPHDGVLTGLVFSLSLHTDHLHSTGVEGCWDAHLRTWERTLNPFSQSKYTSILHITLLKYTFWSWNSLPRSSEPAGRVWSWTWWPLWPPV